MYSVRFWPTRRLHWSDRHASIIFITRSRCWTVHKRYSGQSAAYFSLFVQLLYCFNNIALYIYTYARARFAIVPIIRLLYECIRTWSKIVTFLFDEFEIVFHRFFRGFLLSQTSNIIRQRRGRPKNESKIIYIFPARRNAKPRAKCAGVKPYL